MNRCSNKQLAAFLAGVGLIIVACWLLSPCLGVGAVGLFVLALVYVSTRMKAEGRNR